MHDVLRESLKRLKRNRVRRTRIIAIVLVLSLVVSLNVFWALRQPGLTLAGDADCGIREHIHNADCQSTGTACTLREHTHSVGCYSDPAADVETLLDWQKMFESYPYTGNLREDLVGIAKTQVGYTESEKNFTTSSDGIRRGYTRYGAWYGAPYNDWSAIFVSFCLNYAGADPANFPGNIGATSMAALWKRLGQYIDVNQYTPVSGDLLFFKDNTVGIVAQAYRTCCYVIRGDVDGAVSGKMLSFADPSIAGWGVTEVLPGNKDAPDTGQPDDTPTAPFIDPVFSIYEGAKGFPQPTVYSLRNTRAIIDLLDYLRGHNGSYFFTLMNLNNEELPKDTDGNYIAIANTGYKLAITFTSPEGFLPGTYQYQVPNGLMVDGGEGSFVLKDDANVGSWVVTDTGLITLVFNEHISSHADITISSTLGIHFPEQEEPIDFDGLISVKVEPPVQRQDPTVLSKWGVPNADAGKIDWTVRIDGHADSQIPGSILSDQPALSDWSRPHTYTEADMAAGLSFGVTSADGLWHNWHVSADDPHLIWDENGWSYKIPKTVTCDYCGELELGNEGWIYLVHYSSTPTPLNTPGTFDYENKVTVDGQTAWGWSNFDHGEVEAQIVKDGYFVSDAAGGGFLWEFQVTIPGRVEGTPAEYAWFIMDEMRLLDENGIAIGRVHNDVNLAMVMATYNGNIIQIPRIQDATAQDMFAWDNAWSSDDNGINATRTINLLCRCQCTPESCHWGNCENYWYTRDDGTSAINGFCQCWTETQNMTFTFVYRTTDLEIAKTYGSLGYQVNNLAQLYYMLDGKNSVRIDGDDAVVPIPNLFEKQLTHDFDGYTAKYKITVNESKLSLTNGTPLYIHDMMTKTLSYISGSLVITTEDAGGNVKTLRQGTDYTVTYDGSGNEKDESGNEVHVLDIVILHPQPVMYILDYDATLIIPDKVTEGIKYTNSATITLWGESIKDTTAEKVYADINISSKSYKVEMYKTSGATGEPLAGAIFGLYNGQGGLIASATTDINGRLHFQTNVSRGIILREHTLYYMQELRAPPGYQLDDTKFWFCFCDTTDDVCETCDEVLDGITAVRIPFEQTGNIRITNELAKYAMPATGGPGIYPLILGSIALILTPLLYRFIRGRKRERRGYG